MDTCCTVGVATASAPTSYQFAEAILRGRQPSALIRAFLQEAWERSGETVILATLDRAASVATYVECLDSPQLVRYTVPAGSVRPLYCSAAGQALLAAQPVSWQARYLSHTELRPLTPSTVTQRVRLQQRLDQIAIDGVSTSVGEAVPGAAGLAVPVVRTGGVVNEAILIAGPAERIRAHLPELRELLLDISTRLSAAMGHEPDPATVDITRRPAGIAAESRPY